MFLIFEGTLALCSEQKQQTGLLNMLKLQRNKIIIYTFDSFLYLKKNILKAEIWGLSVFELQMFFCHFMV